MKSDFTVSGISVIIFIENETFQDVARNDIEFLRWGSQIFPALPTITATTKDGMQDSISSLPSSAPEIVINEFVAKSISLFPLQSSAQKSPRRTRRKFSSRSMLQLYQSREDTGTEL